jgi:hypothetical protein
MSALNHTPPASPEQARQRVMRRCGVGFEVIDRRWIAHHRGNPYPGHWSENVAGHIETNEEAAGVDAYFRGRSLGSAGVVAYFRGLSLGSFPNPHAAALAIWDAYVTEGRVLAAQIADADRLGYTD